MICPQCGEDNSDGFRFCGMCGTLLEARVEARRPAGSPIPTLPKVAVASEPLRRPVADSANQPANNLVPPIGGPSMLGLGQIPASANYPSPDSLREKSFSGLDSFFEPERPKGGGGRILLLLVLLGALGGAAWWTYTNYSGTAESRKLRTVISRVSETAAEKLSAKPTAPAAQGNDAANKDTSPAPDAGSSTAGVPSGKAAETASDAPDTARKTANAEAKPATEPNPVSPARTPMAEKSTPKREPRQPSAKAAKLPPATAADSGDAEFQKGAAYLYGRGAPENCTEAVKNLKAASAKSNAKARSAFGTMYATGHCVPRDLPTSYLWFAQALRVDPNNQILEKDLNAVWNQMTPPERQMATRMKQ